MNFEYLYSILAFLLGGMLIAYGITFIRSVPLPYYRSANRSQNKGWKRKNHVRNVGKILLLTASAPFISGIIGLFITPEVSPWPVVISLFGGMGAALLFGKAHWGRK